MEYNQTLNQENTNRIVEVISELTGINQAEVHTAIQTHGLQKVLKDPTLISGKANDKLKALKTFIENSGEKNYEK